MTLRTRFTLWWHSKVMRAKSTRWDPIVYGYDGRLISTDMTLGWVSPLTFWDTIFDLPKKVRSLYERALVFYYYHIHLSIPLDKLT